MTNMRYQKETAPMIKVNITNGHRHAKNVLLCLGLAAGLALNGCSSSLLYSFRDLWEWMGRGTETLYRMQDYEGQGQDNFFTPGARWRDTDGNLIQAHGGQVQQMLVPDENGDLVTRYVWVGEDKNSGHLGNCVAVYTSEDLYHWEFRGDVLRSVKSREELDTDPYFQAVYAGYTDEQLDHVYECINTEAVIERPKMLHNEKTGKYVIWFHNDNLTEANPSYKYDVGMSGVAISDSPFGPFHFVDRYRLSHCPEGQIDCYPTSKGEARDMNLFKDTDGTGYVVYTSENNKALYISKLNDEYTYLCTDPEKAVHGMDYIRLFPGAMREAPALAKGDDGRYYLVSSSTTGWMSNQARMWSADTIFGTWQNDGNPCVGADAGITFDSQSTCLFRAENGQWIYCGDRWNGDELYDSRYIWLPVTFEDGKATIQWKETWEW